MIPFGSKSLFNRLIRSIDVSAWEYDMKGAFIEPKPCSADMEPL